MKLIVSSLYAARKSCFSIQRHISTQAIHIELPEAIRESPVLTEKYNSSRTMILNRPRSMNSINAEMVDIMLPYLATWETSEHVDLVLLKGNGRTLSAGGDIKEMCSKATNLLKRHELDYYIDTFYKIVQLVGTMNTPIVSLMNGYTIGGACSLSTLAHFGVATRNTKVSMPETRFGHFCDVGSSFFLSRLNGYLGRYLALTAKTIVAEDVMFAGLATHFIPTDQIEALEYALKNLDKPNQDIVNLTIDKFSVKAGHLPYSNTLQGKNRKIISECFRFDTIGEILESLEKEGSEFSINTIEQISKGSPLAIAVTLEQIKKGSKLSLNQCIRMEHRSWHTSPYQPDFYEGIMATMVKKQTPQWTHSNFSTIDIEADVCVKYIYANTKRHLNFLSERDINLAPQSRKYGLPSEYEVIRAKAYEEDIQSDQDLIKWFVDKCNNKYGVKQEVMEIINNTETMKYNK